MQIKLLCVLAAAAAASALTACAHKPEAAATPPPSALSADYKRQVAAVGHNLERRDREQEAQRREEMARLVDVRVLKTKDGDRTFSFLLQVRNKAAKPIKTLGEGLEVHDAAGKRIGLLEIDGAPVAVPAHGTIRHWQTERYLRFGDETASMTEARSEKKTAAVKVIEITYADGSHEGGDD